MMQFIEEEKRKAKVKAFGDYVFMEDNECLRNALENETYQFKGARMVPGTLKKKDGGYFSCFFGPYKETICCKQGETPSQETKVNLFCSVGPTDKEQNGIFLKQVCKNFRENMKSILVITGTHGAAEVNESDENGMVISLKYETSLDQQVNGRKEFARQDADILTSFQQEINIQCVDISDTGTAAAALQKALDTNTFDTVILPFCHSRAVWDDKSSNLSKLLRASGSNS